MAKDTYVFTHVGHKFISNRAIWNKYASMGSFFFFFKNIAQTLAVPINEIGSACFFLGAQEISLKDFWQCATLYSQFQFP